MKKKIAILLTTAALVATTLTGCNWSAKHFGGDITITLEPGVKLEEMTWKEDSLWYLTRPMREDETAETHTFIQDSNWGVFEGTVTVIEQEEE